MDLGSSHRHPCDLHESAAGWMEQLADVGWSDPTASGLDDHATSGNGQTRHSNGWDSEPLLADSRLGIGPGICCLDV